MGMSSNVSCVPYHDGSSSYSLRCVSPQGDPRGISHVREHGNEVQERNLWTNSYAYDYIGNNLACGDIPHCNSHLTGMQNTDDGTMKYIKHKTHQLVTKGIFLEDIGIS